MLVVLALLVLVLILSQEFVLLLKLRCCSVGAGDVYAKSYVISEYIRP